MKILVAIDLSPASEKVITVARDLALKLSAEIIVIHAAEPDPDFVGFDAGPGVVRDQVAKEFREEHRQVQAHAQSLRDAGVEAKGLLLQGSVAHTTLREARRCGADLIVVGSHGRGAIYSAVVGSYSSAILHGAEVPVIVVPVRDA